MEQPTYRSNGLHVQSRNAVDKCDQGVCGCCERRERTQHLCDVLELIYGQRGGTATYFKRARHAWDVTR